MIPDKCFFIVKQNPTALFGIRHKNCTKIISFGEKYNADKCRRALAVYKKTTGKWPFNSKTEMLNLELKDIIKQLDIVYSSSDDMIEFCNMHNLGMIICDEFSVLENNIRFKGTQFEPPENYELIKDYLETLIE